MNQDEIASATDAVLLKRAKTLASRRGTVSTELRSLVDELRRRSSDAPNEQNVAGFLSSLDLLSADELIHPDVMAITREHGIRTIPHADSFWRSILARRRKKQLGTVPEKYLGITKDSDERFARQIGVATTQTLYRGDLSGVPRDKAPTVIKPVRSSDSRGAFYVFDEGLYSIAQSKTVADWTELEEVAEEELRGPGADPDLWELQELVTREGRPAHDLKFYCFYGEIGAVLEIARYPKPQYAYFDGDLQPINFRLNPKPSFADINDTAVMAGSLTQDKLDTVRRMSLTIPAPFMRIDFLDADQQLVFCEFSSAPGFSHALVPEHDARLGEAYHRAEIRLINDFLDGKGFDAFREFSRAPRT